MKGLYWLHMKQIVVHQGNIMPWCWLAFLLWVCFDTNHPWYGVGLVVAYLCAFFYTSHCAIKTFMQMNYRDID